MLAMSPHYCLMSRHAPDTASRMLGISSSARCALWKGMQARNAQEKRDTALDSSYGRTPALRVEFSCKNVFFAHCSISTASRQDPLQKQRKLQHSDFAEEACRVAALNSL